MAPDQLKDPKAIFTSQEDPVYIAMTAAQRKLYDDFYKYYKDDFKDYEK